MTRLVNASPFHLIVSLPLLLALCGSTLGCSNPGERSGHPAETGHADSHSSGEVSATPTLAGTPGGDPGSGPATAVGLELAGVRGVSFAPVGEPREEGAWLAAEAISDPGAESVLSAPLAGQVIAFHALPGARLERGAPVVELRSPELADLAARLVTARARRARAESDLARERRLSAAAATSARELEAAEAEALVAAAEEQGARLALEGRGIDPERVGTTYLVRAAQSGTLARLDVALGESVESGRRLGSLVAAGAALAQVDIPLPGPQGWLPGAETEVRRADGKRWNARVEGAPPALTAETRRLTFRLRLAGDDLPLAGTPLEVRVPLARAVVLPQTALQQIEGSWGVFVQRGDHAELRAITKGPELGGDVLVLAGVAPGEIVAVEGAYLLKALWLKRAGGGEGDHDH